ncbi:MAG TPA: alpha/beta fold hydrolase [Candidatus Angelobacter sp.]|nr:alpha/beta fold hydrolase [Candidatus Angelobacter sp.]
MKKSGRVILLIFAGIIACSPHRLARAQTLFIAHPDDPVRKVEYFLEKPAGSGPWPAIILLHGHQDWPRAGGKDFVNWGVLDDFADRGYLAVSISQPGYGNSTGPADFCGPLTQHAVAAVIARIRSNGYVKGNKILIQGVSRGAMVAGLLASQDSRIGGVVMISGAYDLPEYVRNAQSPMQKSVVESLTSETGGSEEALRSRSLLYFTDRLKTPVLILNGAKDDRTGPSQALSLAEAINKHGGHARAIIYPQYGHQIPVEVRNKDIGPFIEQVLGR